MRTYCGPLIHHSMNMSVFALIVSIVFDVFLHVYFASLLPPPPKVMGGYVYRYAYMFMNNFLAQIQVRLLPYFVRHTLGLRGRGD